VSVLKFIANIYDIVHFNVTFHQIKLGCTDFIFLSKFNNSLGRRLTNF